MGMPWCPELSLYPGGLPHAAEGLASALVGVEILRQVSAGYEPGFLYRGFGGCDLVLHLTAAMNNDEYASLLDVHPAKLGLRALGLKSAMADLDRLFDENAYDAGGLVELAPCFTRYVERERGRSSKGSLSWS